MIETIVIEYAAPSKKNPQYGSVKSQDGRWFDTTLPMVEALRGQRGQAVAVEVVQNAKGYSQIRGFAGQPQQGYQPPPQVVQQAQQQGYRQPSNSAQRPRPQDDGTPERIYVCGIVNAAIHSQQVSPLDAESLVNVTNAARQAYRRTFGGQPAPVPQQQPMSGPPGPEPPPFDDSVPF